VSHHTHPQQTAALTAAATAAGVAALLTHLHMLSLAQPVTQQSLSRAALRCAVWLLAAVQCSCCPPGVLPLQPLPLHSVRQEHLYYAAAAVAVCCNDLVSLHYRRVLHLVTAALQQRLLVVLHHHLLLLHGGELHTVWAAAKV
jgi:hypothetical protein